MIVQVCGFNVEIIRKKIKSIRLKVKMSDASVVVSAPVFLPQQKILDFIKDKEAWIISQKQKALQNIKILNREYSSGDIVTFLGKQYVLEISLSSRARWIFEGDKLLLFVKTQNCLKEDVLRLLEDVCKRLIISYISQKLPFYEALMSLKSSSFMVRKMKTRWGSCNTKTKKLCFNSELAKKDLKCIDYVIVHELSHLVYANHKKEFWQLVERYFPDWRVARKKLR